MSSTTVLPAVLVTANRAVAYGVVARWLLHDLRNPAQALSLAVELFGVFGPDPEADADLHTTLRESVRHLADCVEMLDRSLRTMPRPTAPGPVSLPDVLRFLEQLYIKRKAVTRLDVAPALATPMPLVSGVEDHLEHALLNLLMNAIEATKDQIDGHIAISAAVEDGHVEIVIDDNGVGVAPEVESMLFEPYTTTKPPSVRATGLGLAVARHLLSQSNGIVTYAPKSSPGARFVMRLPTWTSTSAS